MENKIRIIRSDLFFDSNGVSWTTRIVKKRAIAIAISADLVCEVPIRKDHKERSGNCDLDLPPGRHQKFERHRLDHCGLWNANSSVGTCNYNNIWWRSVEILRWECLGIRGFGKACACCIWQRIASLFRRVLAMIEKTRGVSQSWTVEEVGQFQEKEEVLCL